MAEDLKTLTRRWFEEVWNKGRADAIDEMFDEEGFAHGLGQDGGSLKGPAEFKAFQAAYVGAFPDISITVENAIQEGDWCAARFSGGGTHTGEGLGFAATNRAMAFAGICFARWRNGKIVGAYNEVNIDGIMKQLGV